MIKRLTILFIFLGGAFAGFSQNLGISFSFFFPKNGEMAVPISPFSYRGLALPFTNNVGIQSGISIYRMPGLNIKDMPLESSKPMYGPNATGYIPLELYFQAGSQSATFTIKAGVFGFYSVFTKLNYGNIDRAIMTYEDWRVANADFTYRKAPGWGYQGGVELLINVTREFGITMEVNYLLGSSPLEISGSYTGGNTTLETITVDYPDAAVDFSGIEVSLGAVF